MTNDGEATERALDAAFERRLLESARSDAPAEGASRAAWVRFAAVAGGTALGAGAEVGGSALVRAVRRAGARWFVVGAVSGSALTAWIVTSRAPVTVALPGAAVSAPLTRAPEPRGSEPEVARARVAAAVTAPGRVEVEISARHDEAKPARVATPKVRSIAEIAPPIRNASTLAAEIEALDAVRTALARRDFDRAFELAERYPRAFPAGQLGADAAALGIEALAGQGNRVEAKRRAALFAERYPNDPHRARVAAIAER